MSKEIAIKIDKLGKMYKIYDHKRDKIIESFGIKHKKKKYKEFWALRDVDLKISKGERVGIIGRNGAGKSTLLKTICGNISPTEGDIDIKGDIQALMELGTGFHPEFTGRENIRASLAYQGLSKKAIDNKIDEIIDFSELEEFIDRPIKTYSAGMYARLGFSTATAIEPDILIIDEVLGAGDAYFNGKCMERMKKITKESGATVLFVSHDLSSVMQLCDRIVWINKGKVVMDGDPLLVMNEYNQMIREEDELRLRARDLKISKKNMASIDSHDDLYDSLFFHLVPEKTSLPIGDNKIFDIMLKKMNDKLVGGIDLGEPMDNDANQDAYVIDDMKYMNWSKPEQYGDRCRLYGNYKGLYGHAPFIFNMPKNNRKESLCIEVTAEVVEPLKLEIFIDGKYETIGFLNKDNSKEKYRFVIDKSLFKSDNSELEVEESVELASIEKNCELNDVNQDEVLLNDKVENEEILDKDSSKKIFEYGEKIVSINAVKLLDDSNVDRKIFETEKNLKIEFDITVNAVIKNPVMVFCIYTSSGVCASQLVEEIHEVILAGAYKFKFDVEKLRIGKGSYVASAAVFKEMAKSYVEPECYHVIDRSIHFEVVQPFGDQYDKGFCIQDYTSEFQR